MQHDRDEMAGEDLPAFAILTPPGDPARREAAMRLAGAAGAAGAARCVVLDRADGLRDPGFAFILTMCALQPKLSAVPSYALFERSELDAVPANEALARILSHDGYLVGREEDRRFLADLLFGSRKQAAPILDLPPLAPPEHRAPEHRACTTEPAEGLLVVLTAPPDRERVALCRDLARRHGIRVVSLVPAAVEAAAASGLPAECICADGKALAAVAAAHRVALCLGGAGRAGSVLAGDLCRVALATAGCLVLSDEVAPVPGSDGQAGLLDGEAPASFLRWQVERHLARLSGDEAVARALAEGAREQAMARGAAPLVLQRLLDMHRAVLTDRGYRPASEGDGDLPAVAYVVRAGGRPRAYLERALASLERQGVPMTVVVVLWRETPENAELLARPWRFALKVLHRPGAGSDRALAEGLAAVKASGAAWFGLLDDDDELHPNHVRTLLKTLAARRRLALPEAQVAYCGAVEMAEDGFGSPAADTIPLPVPALRLRLGAFFFPNPRRLWSPAAHLPPHCWLASTRLIDEELLAPSGLDLGEDTHLLNLLAERSRFVFSCEATVTYHYHGAGQSGWWRDPAMAEKAERLSLRMVGRAALGEGGGYGRENLPPIDDRLGAGILKAEPMESTAPVLLSRTLRLEDSRAATAEAVSLPAGQSVLRWYFADSGDGSEVAELSARLHVRRADGSAETMALGPLAVHRRGPGWHLAHPLRIGADDRFDRVALSLELDQLVPGSGDALPLAMTVSEALDGVFVPWSALPQAGRVWIFGAGSAGRAALRQLTAVGQRPRVAGFVDSQKTGELDGLPILPPSALRTAPEADLVLIASQFWREIARTLAGTLPNPIGCTHPINAAGLRLLT
ncbi:glycosyltransferase family A protein [Azospirillum sp. SYSU D00513]|uniref:glycosyltransferase family A protein n=1 Tax=Azospirillum sp. SYSU D00513 TaxID=2812561 RepID=UPI001A9564BA|nr:glycosyltransferase family A protein [Azospirillum sp. SYSU D00513]